MIGRLNFAFLTLSIALFITCATLSGCGSIKNEGAMLTKPIIDSVEASIIEEDTGDMNRQIILEMTGHVPSFAGTTYGVPLDNDYFNGRYRITSTDLASPSTPLGECTVSGGEFKISVSMQSLTESLLEYRYPLITIYDNFTGTAVYRAVPGRVPQIYEIPAGLKKLYVKNVRLVAISTARTAVIMERGAPDIPIITMTRREVVNGVIIKVLSQEKATDFEIASDRKFGGAANVISLSYAAEAAAIALTQTNIPAYELKTLIPISRDNPVAVAQTYVRLLNYELFSMRISRHELKFEAGTVDDSHSFTIGASTPVEAIPGLFSGILSQENISGN